MRCRWHGRAPGRRIGLGLLLAALILASVVFFLVDRHLSSVVRFTPGRDGWRIGKIRGKGRKPAGPPPTPSRPAAPVLLPLPPGRLRTGPEALGASFAYADEDGSLLSVRRPVLESPDGKSSLMLQRDGNLVLRTEAPGGGPPTIVWSTGTGGRNATGTLAVTVASPPGSSSRHPVLELSSTAAAGARTVLWHSALIPACAANDTTTPVNATIATTAALAPARLELYGSGRLTLTGACDLHVPPAEREGTRALAVILSGRYRPGAGAGCARGLLAHPSFSTVDVFANVVLGDDEDGDAGKLAEAELRECYGAALRAVVVRSKAEAGDGSDLESVKEQLGTCRGEVEALDERLRGLRDAGRTWWEWSAEGGGGVHDTVLAMRADADIAEGAALSGFRMLGELGEGLVVVRHGDADDDDVYCRRVTGGVGIAPSAHMTYGTPASMAHYLNVHTTPDLPTLVRLASGAEDGPGFSGCDVLPSGPGAADCPRPAACATECLVAWYLDSVGVGYEVEWW